MIQALNANAVKLKNQRGRLSGFATALDGHKMAVGNERLANRLHWRKLGPTNVPAQLFPEDKVELLKQLKAAGLSGMVGDGINDALALAAADVGIAMGVVAVGYAFLWGAVLADVGTCLLVIFNKAEPWCPKKMEENRVLPHDTKQENEYCLSYCATKSCCDVRGANNGMRQRMNNRDACEKDCQCIAINEGLLVNSDAADVGSEVEIACWGVAVKVMLSEVASAPIRHLNKHEDEQDMILQYYSEEWGHSKESSQMDVTGRSNFDLGPLVHLGVWALKFALVQSYKHFIAAFQNCSFNNTYLLEATEENKIKVLGKDFGGCSKIEEADDSVWEDAEDGSENPFFSEQDFNEAFNEMASRENLANFDSFPSSEEGPFKFNMIEYFGRQNYALMLIGTIAYSQEMGEESHLFI
ncbi:hypothetical protein L7F22_014889 [Adiantum nelumboides]|nr:hypothetical protein [Adiantum nelumboides]